MIHKDLTEPLPINASDGIDTLPLDKVNRVFHAEEVVALVRAIGKRVVVFLGFGELGYQDEGRMRAIVRSELQRLPSEKTLVLAATLITKDFKRGIADVYPIARSMGFESCGIHLSIALTSPKRHALSRFVDRVFSFWTRPGVPIWPEQMNRVPLSA